MAGFRTMVVVGLGLSLSGRAVAQTPAPVGIPSGAFGGFSSRFVPVDIWMRMLERPEDAPASTAIAADRDAVWVALEEVLKKLDVPLTFSDRTAGEMGALNAKVYRRLGKEPLSNYIRCGEGVTGPNADTYVVYLSVLGFLRPAPQNETMLVTLVAAQAVDLPNGRNELMTCTTIGRLEARVAKEVMKKVYLK